MAGIVEEIAPMRCWKQSILTAAFALAALVPAGQALAQADVTPETIPLLTSPAFAAPNPRIPLA